MRSPGRQPALRLIEQAAALEEGLDKERRLTAQQRDFVSMTSHEFLNSPDDHRWTCAAAHQDEQPARFCQMLRNVEQAFAAPYSE